MNTNLNNRYQVAGPNRQIVPGLKVAYGEQTTRNEFDFDFVSTAQKPTTPVSKSFYARVWDKFLDLVTEEAEADRPIGISQLTQKTFQAGEHTGGNTFFRHGHTPQMQDYRFSQLANPRR